MQEVQGQLESTAKALQGRTELQEEEIEVLRMDLLAKDTAGALQQALADSQPDLPLVCLDTSCMLYIQLLQLQGQITDCMCPLSYGIKLWGCSCQQLTCSGVYKMLVSDKKARGRSAHMTLGSTKLTRSGSHPQSGARLQVVYTKRVASKLNML